MAKNVSVVITDDLDGSADAKTVLFGLDGVAYEIDLGKPNRDKLERSLAPFIEAGRRISIGSRRSSASRSRGGSGDRSAIRAWAREAGLEVPERGRISAEILRQYEAAH